MQRIDANAPRERMRVGVMVPMSLSDGVDGMPTWSDIRAFAQQADETGIDAVWVCDHFLSGEPGVRTKESTKRGR
jgi:alkanesulfonate monooxygenase SsuD/methylene tetrahydromethanopterin reductase-like flavin-dependent oxidoreductase (luciferase family)